MLKRVLLALALALPLVFPAAPPPVAAQTEPYFVHPRVDLRNTSLSKFPHVVAHGSQVVVSVNADSQDALFFEKADIADAFTGPIQLGEATGQPDYATTGVRYAADGTLYYIWSDFDNGRIYLRVRPPTAGADFGPARVVTGSSSFPADPEVAVSDFGNTRRVFAFWREAGGEIRYRYSDNDGVSWSGVGTVRERGSFPEIQAFSAPGGKVAVGFTAPGGPDGDLKVYLAYWNGDGFTTERVAPADSGNFADPSIGVLADGTWVMAYTGIDDGGNYGTYYSERQPNGTWPTPRIDRGNINSVSLATDPLGNVHLYWAGIPNRTGRLNVYYAYKRAGETNFSRVIASSGLDRQPVFNLNAGANLRDLSYGHSVVERFDGGTARTSYTLAAAPSGTVGAEASVIEQGAQYTNKANVRVDFTAPTGNPTQVRYSWGAPPTDDAPVVDYANPVTIPAPTLPNPNGCNNLVLYKQLIATGAVQTVPISDSIIFDRDVQATVGLTPAVPSFDPTFTSSPSMTLRVAPNGECVGLSAASAAGDIQSTVSFSVTNQAATQPIDLTAAEGVKNVGVTVTDLLGNTRLTTVTVTLDQTAPELVNPGIVTTTAGLDFSGVVDVAATGLEINEAHLYGAEIIVAVTPISGSVTLGSPAVLPLTASNLMKQEDGSYNLNFDWSLATGLDPEALVAGEYEVRMRLVDRAGNRSEAQTIGTIAFEAAPIFPKLYAPLVSR